MTTCSRQDCSAPSTGTLVVEENTDTNRWPYCTEHIGDTSPFHGIGRWGEEWTERWVPHTEEEDE